MNYQIKSNTPVEIKFCITCKKEKPLTEFHITVARPDGLSADCKNCVAVRGKKWVKTRGYYIRHNHHTTNNKKPFTLLLNEKTLGSYGSRLACEKVREKHHLKQVLDAREMAQIEAKAQEEYYL